VNAQSLLDRAQQLGITIRIVGGHIRYRPKSVAPSEFVEKLGAHKAEVIELLQHREVATRYRREIQGDYLGEGELVEIVRRVWDEGVCLVWAKALGDFVAFYRSEADLPKIPPGFVPYSDAELLHLFGREQPVVSLSTLRLIHAAKKKGARITGVEPDTAPGA
jgi:hypothetical protein